LIGISGDECPAGSPGNCESSCSESGGGLSEVFQGRYPPMARMRE
jgi:hypothetical protein